MGLWCGQCDHFLGKIILSFQKKKKNNSAGMVWHTKHEAEVRFKPSSNTFSRNTVCLNTESNLAFGSAAHLNLGLNFGPVLQSSGSNFGSGLNFSNTRTVSRWRLWMISGCWTQMSLLTLVPQRPRGSGDQNLLHKVGKQD